MKKITGLLLALILCTVCFAAYGTQNYMETGGAKWVVGGTIDVTGALKVGGVQVTATAAELNTVDLSAQTSTITTGAVSVTKKVTNVATTTAATISLAAPDASMIGTIKVIQMTTDGGDATLSLANVVGQSSGTSAVFNDVGDALILIGGANSKWIVIKEYGITLS